MPHEENDEPDVTPLINVNLVILVMALAIASHAARLLPLAFPKAETTELLGTKSAVSLTVLRDGRVRLASDELEVEQVATALAALEPGTVVTVHADAGIRYAAFVKIVDQISSVDGIEMAFGNLAGGAAE